MRDDDTQTWSPPPVAHPDVPDDDVAYAGEGWSAYEGEVAEGAAWETDIDTTPVDPAEMIGVWLTTEGDRESPLRLDGAPAEPEDLDLPDDLADRLRDWAQMWRDDWDPDRGWGPRARIGDYEALGAWLARRVKDHVGAVSVTLQPAHLGRSGIEVIEAPESRRPIRVRLMNDYGRTMPVWGDFVTDSGVGSFSSEINARLEAWARRFADHMDPYDGWDDPRSAADDEDDAYDLADAMAEELGPDYEVDVELWELRATQATPAT